MFRSKFKHSFLKENFGTPFKPDVMEQYFAYGEFISIEEVRKFLNKRSPFLFDKLIKSRNFLARGFGAKSIDPMQPSKNFDLEAKSNELLAIGYEDELFSFFAHLIIKDHRCTFKMAVKFNKLSGKAYYYSSLLFHISVIKYLLNRLRKL